MQPRQTTAGSARAQSQPEARWLQFCCTLCTIYFSGTYSFSLHHSTIAPILLTKSTARSCRCPLGYRDLTKVFQYVLILTQKYFRSEDIGLLFQPWQTTRCLWKEHRTWELDPILQRLIRYLLQAHNSSFSGPFMFLIWCTWVHHVESGSNMHS